MNIYERKVIKDTVSAIKSVKKTFGQFSYELDEDYSYDSNNDNDTEYLSDNDFKDAITEQREKLDKLYIDLNNLLEDYTGEYEYEIHQAQMAIDSASLDLQSIENNYCCWNGPGASNDELVSSAEHLDEAIEYLESTLNCF